MKNLETLIAQAQQSKADEAIELLQQACSLADPLRSAELLLWMAQLQAKLALWQEAQESLEKALELDPDNPDTRQFLSEALVRNGLPEQAIELLGKAQALSAEEQHRLAWLQAPQTRCAALSETQPILHSLYGTKAIEKVLLQPYGSFPGRLFEALREFHEREFPGNTMEILPLCAATVPEDFEQLRDLLDVGEFPSWAQTQDLAFVSAESTNATAYSAGFGSPRMVVLKFSSGDPFQQTVAAHELYHSLLELNHSNGLEGPDDPRSVMGPWGIRTALKATYICDFHRRCCSTTAEVQSLVDAGAWEEALKKEPFYLALYQKLATKCVRERRAEQAISHLQSWFELDPGPEAASALGEMLLHLGRCPRQVFARALGYNSAANTHLYAAQACLNAYSFVLALQELQKAVELEPENIHAQGMMAWALHALGQKERATKLYQQVLARCPDWESLRGRLCWLQAEPYQAPYPDEELLWLQSQTMSAQQGVQILQNLGGQKALHRLGWLYFQCADESRAMAAFAACLDLHPYSLEGKASKAWIDFLEKKDGVLELAREVLEIWKQEASCLQLTQLLKPSKLT